MEIDPSSSARKIEPIWVVWRLVYGARNLNGNRAALISYTTSASQILVCPKRFSPTRACFSEAVPACRILTARIF
jgi:hypothetical protein